MTSQTLIFQLQGRISKADESTLDSQENSIHKMVVREDTQDQACVGWGFVVVNQETAKQIVGGQNHSQCPVPTQLKTGQELWAIKVSLPCISCRYQDFCVHVIQDGIYPFSCRYFNANVNKT